MARGTGVSERLLLFRNASHVGVATADPSEALLGHGSDTEHAIRADMSRAMCRTFCPVEFSLPGA